MILLLDVDYRDPAAVCAGVLAHRWSDEHPAHTVLAPIERVEPYVSGSFYLRELPCLLAAVALARAIAPIDTVVIDAHVYLDDALRKGLGAHLYEALATHTPVVGIAKTRFDPSPRGPIAVEVLRGASAQPLYVSAAGVSALEAAAHVRSMHGAHRIPTLVRRVDRLCRDA